MYTTKVNVNDLVIDMPLDEANVAQKMESLKAGGLVQPVTVWLQDFRIIDGFHRTEAAKRLGWTEIDCVVKDCDEETFWDARIQSARQHHKITDQRFVSWITQCWMATEWHEEMSSSDSAKLELAKAIWGIKTASKHTHLNVLQSEVMPVPKRKQDIDKSSLNQIQVAMLEWVEEKARLWEYDTDSLWSLIFSSVSGVPFNDTTVDAMALAKGLNFRDRLHLGRTVDKVSFGNDNRFKIATEDNVGGYIDYAKERGLPLGKKAFAAYVEKKNYEREQRLLEKEIARTKEEKEKQLARKQAEEAYLMSPQGQAQIRKELRWDLGQSINVVKSVVKQHQDVFIQLDDGYEMLMSLSAWAATKAAELFPDREQPTEIQLRRELADAYKQIQSLQKALDSRKSYRPNLPEVMAYSSTEIAKAG